MKKYSKIGIFCLVSLFTLSALTPIALSATTIGDTTFPADVGKRYEWRFTYPTEYSGAKFRFTADSITQGVYMTIDSLIVFATLEFYIPSPVNEWQTWVNNTFYLAANETQKFLYVDYDEFDLPWVIPTPINLTLLGEAIAIFPDVLSHSVDGNTITINEVGGYSYEYTYNSNGFLSVGIEYDTGEMSAKFVFGAGGEDMIPFGTYFLVPTVSSIAVIVIFMKKRQARIK